MASASMRRASLLLALVVGATLVAAQAPPQPSQQQDGVFEYPTSAAKVLVLGRAANLKVFRNRTSAEHLHLRFGKVEEVDAAGRPIPKRAINSLAALQPTSYSTGVRTSGETDYTYVRLTYDASALRLSECPSAEELAALGYEDAAAKAGARPAAAGAAGSTPQQQQRRQQEAGVRPQADDAPEVKTIGDSRLAAALAALTGGAGGAADRRRRLQQSVSAELLDKSGASRDPVYYSNDGYALEFESGQVSGDAAARSRLRRGGASRAAGAVASSSAGAGMPSDSVPGPVAVGNPDVAFRGIVSRAEAGKTGSVTLAGGGAAAGGNGGALNNGGSPTIALTFFFGMTANKTFAYGRGNSVTVPADGVKFNIEAASWPFCSPLHSLRFDVALSSNMQANSQAQMTLDSLEVSPEAADMSESAFGAPVRRHSRRRLMQPGADAYIDLETASALASAAAGRAPGLPVRTVKLLTSPTSAAAVECAKVAYPRVGAAVNTTVGISLLNAAAGSDAPDAAGKDAKAAAGAAKPPQQQGGSGGLGSARLSFTFPYFETLFYDPVISFGSTDGMSVDVDALRGGAASSCAGGAVTCGRTAEKHTSGAARATFGGAAAAAAMLLMLLV